MSEAEYKPRAGWNKMRNKDVVFVEPNPGDEEWPWKAVHRRVDRTFQRCGKWSGMAGVHQYDLIEYIGETLPEKPASQPEPVETRIGWWRCDSGEFANVQGPSVLDGYFYGIVYVGDKEWPITWTPSGKVMSGSMAYHETHRFKLVEYWGTEDPRTPVIEVHEMRPEPEPSEPVRRQVGGDHYMNMGLQPVDVIEATFTPDEVRGFYKGLILKHTMRAGRKPGDSNLQELGKAQHYAEMLLAYERKQKAKGE